MSAPAWADMGKRDEVRNKITSCRTADLCHLAHAAASGSWLIKVGWSWFSASGLVCCNLARHCLRLFSSGRSDIPQDYSRQARLYTSGRGILSGQACCNSCHVQASISTRASWLWGGLIMDHSKSEQKDGNVFRSQSTCWFNVMT